MGFACTSLRCSCDVASFLLLLDVPWRRCRDVWGWIGMVSHLLLFILAVLLFTSREGGIGLGSIGDSDDQ
jgi:hypothetical protein